MARVKPGALVHVTQWGDDSWWLVLNAIDHAVDALTGELRLDIPVTDAYRILTFKDGDIGHGWIHGSLDDKYFEVFE